jgi:DNA segregation ATPase FtsK/SpoIIIE, S-DNA-T family
MAKSRSKKQVIKPQASLALLPTPRGLLWIVVAVTAIAAIMFFGGHAIFEAIGFGLFLGVLWVAVVVYVAWRQGLGSLSQWWNLWLGAIVFTLALWGIFALFLPSASIANADFSQVSLGGSAGRSFIGNQGAGAPPAARLVILFLIGIGLVIPRPSLRALQFLSQAAKKAGLMTLAGLRWFLPRLRRAAARLNQRYSLSRLLTAPVTALRKRLGLKGTAEPEIGNEEAGEVVASPPESEVAGDKAAPARADAGEQLPLPIPGVKKKKPATAETRESRPQPMITAKQQLPPIELLDKATDIEFSEVGNEQKAKLIEEALRSYGVDAKVMQINPGPSVTQFGIEPGWDRKYKRVVERDREGKAKLDRDGNPVERLEEISKTRVKVERITALSNNLALALATPNIRIEAPVPGKSLVGIEVPNTTTSIVRLRGVIEGIAFQKLKTKTKLAIALGKGSAGEPVSADLCKMPHLLIAGATGSGKTVFINSTITCLLMYNTPRDLRLLLIDPKRVELVSFEGVPHLISPVVTESDKAIDALRRILREMDNRYSKFSAIGVRNIEGYNQSHLATEPMPYLIVIIDELAHLMMSAAEVVEPAICRLAQMSRATGIHLIVATQRPSVDVVTGLIKANFPSRISFAVASGVDSRTILDTVGAETLLGGGDMLYLPPDAPKPKRLRGCFVSDQEIDRVATFWKQQITQTPTPLDDTIAQAFASLPTEELKDEDPLLATGRRLAREYSHLSTSLLQRRLHIGYPRAARIMDLLEEEGTVVRHEQDKPGEVLGEDRGIADENGNNEEAA